MDPIQDACVTFRRITPAGENWFFGYYDNQAFAPDDERHLAHRVAFCDRLQQPGDAADLAVLDLADGSAEVFATTRAWNFQQGAMLQWVGERRNTVFYNAATAAGDYRGIVHDLGRQRVRELPMALADLSNDGRRGLAINFDRVFDFRPGYGYCQKRDPWLGQRHATEDGVWLVDVPRARLRQVLSMQTLWAAMAHAFAGADCKICVNHITFNPTAERFVLLARTFPEGDLKRWATTVFVADLKGCLQATLVDAAMASHYWWSDARRLLFFMAGNAGNQLYEVDVETGAQTVIDAAFFSSDGHCSTSPDGQWLLYDSYPRQGYRYLYLYNLPRRQGLTLAGLYDLPVSVTDIRCDLHPRWNRQGTGISLDATFEGFRGIYTVDLQDVMKERFSRA
jgi:hypothetical protein